MKVVYEKLYHWENMFVLESSYREIISRYIYSIFIFGKFQNWESVIVRR
jgi:hypothetical protein